jgi:hypothetical protein
VGGRNFHYTTPQPFCQEFLRKFFLKIFFLKVLTFAGGYGIIGLPKGGKKEKAKRKKIKKNKKSA